MSHITIRVNDELKEVIAGYAYLQGKSVSEIMLEAIQEKLEDAEDYELALLAAKAAKNEATRPISDLFKECEIDEENL